MNTCFRLFLNAKGLSISAASKLSGIPYVTISQHFNNKRGISPALAIQYEKTLGISRSDLRPDLWPPELERDTESV